MYRPDTDTGPPAALHPQSRPPRVVRMGAFASDPAACITFRGYDPESGMLTPAVTDSLLYLDSEGNIQPSLATSWRRIDPTTMEFDLREGVRFHNGDRFSAKDVVATFRAHLDPANRSAYYGTIFRPIRDCIALSEYRIRIRTHYPDCMSLHRMHIASAVYPSSILEREGPDYLIEHPIGTGAYVFERWERGREIVLSRNTDHWSGMVQIDRLHFPIMPQKDWVDALMSDELDIAVNLDPHDAMRVHLSDTLTMRHRPAAISNWFQLSLKGPLSDRRVRLALNHAIERKLLCTVANHGWATPQASLLTPGQVGYDDSIAPYPYDLDYAHDLLQQAGYGGGFVLRGLVSEACLSVYRLIRSFLHKIGVTLEADIVPRPVWVERTIGQKMRHGTTYDGDFVLVNIDNYSLHGIFHHDILLTSTSPYSIISSAEDAGEECVSREYNQLFESAKHEVEPDKLKQALSRLDRYAYDNALLLFTNRPHLYCGMRKGYDILLNISGHMNTENMWRIRVADGALDLPQQASNSPPAASSAEVDRLLAATSYPGMLYEPERQARYQDQRLATLWRNMELYEERRDIQSTQMLQTLVEQVSASTYLSNVMRSTRQVAIVGITRSGRLMFANSGYEEVMGHPPSTPLADIVLDEDHRPQWRQLTAAVDAGAVLPEIVWVRTARGMRPIHMTVSPAKNEYGGHIGYICISTDHTRELERIAALRDKAAAEEATRLRDRFMSMVSHDLRSPLTGFINALELIRDPNGGLLQDDRDRLLAMVHRGAEGMLELVEQLMDMSRLKTGSLILKKSYVDLHDLVTAGIERQELWACKKAIMLTNQVPPGHEVLVDEAMMGEVFANLLVNAIKFCRPGDEVSIHLDQARPCSIAVSDTGPGIAPNLVPNLFKAEIKTTTVGTEGEMGTGLGLPQCADIVRAHGGEIRVASAVEGGSTFYIDLPQSDTVILLIDGQGAHREMMKHHIDHTPSLSPVVYVEAADAAQAYDVLSTVKPSLIVLDLELPDAAGSAVLSNIRGRTDLAAVPVLVASSMDGGRQMMPDAIAAQRQKVLAQGASDLILKPIHGEAFSGLVHDLMVASTVAST